MAQAIPAIIGIVAAVAGGAMQAVSANQQSRARENAAKYNEAVANQQSSIARQQTEFDKERLRERHRRVMSSQRARFAKSGITLTGTALDVQRDSQIQGELEILARQHRGDLDAASARGQAGLFRMEASQARSGRGLLTAAPIISAAGQAGYAGSTIPRATYAPTISG